MERLMHKIGVLFDPRFWLRVQRVSHEWSDELDRAMDRGDPITSCGRFYCKVGQIEVWIENWPYGYGNLFVSGLNGVLPLPRRKTALRLRRYINDKLVGQAIAKTPTH